MGTSNWKERLSLGFVASLAVAALTGCQDQGANRAGISSTSSTSKSSPSPTPTPTPSPSPTASPTPTPSPTPSPTPVPSPSSSPTPRAQLTSDKSTVAFSKARDNEAVTIQIRNASATPATELKVTLSASSSAYFLSDECDGRQLASDEYCNLIVDFANPEDSALSGAIYVSYRDGNGTRPSLTVALQGPGRRIDSTAERQKSGRTCGPKTITDVCDYGTSSTFDGTACFVGWAPEGKEGFYKNGQFLYSSSPGTPCSSNHYFNGTRCVFLDAVDGKKPFVKFNAEENRWGFYFKPGQRSVETFYEAECPKGSVYDGLNCYVGGAPRGPATVDNVADRYGNLRYTFRYPAAAGTACAESDYYDGKKCQLMPVPDGWTGKVFDKTNLYVQAKNVSCVE